MLLVIAHRPTLAITDSPPLVPTRGAQEADHRGASVRAAQRARLTGSYDTRLFVRVMRGRSSAARVAVAALTWADGYRRAFPGRRIVSPFLRTDRVPMVETFRIGR